MKRIKIGIIVLAILIFNLIFFSITINAQEAKVDIEIDQKTKVVSIKMESSKKIEYVKIYKKSQNGKYILFYVSKAGENKIEYKLNNNFLSYDEETPIKVVIKDEDGLTIKDATIPKREEPVPMNPEETAKPSWSPSPIPTYPTESPNPSQSSQPNPSENPSDSEITTAFDSYTFGQTLATKKINAKSKSGKKLTYSSKDPSIASVDSKRQYNC